MAMLAALLSRSARSNWQIIQGATKRGLTKKATQALIAKRQGRGINNADLGHAMNYFRGVERTGTYLRNVGLDRYPSPQRLRASKAPLTTRFRFEAKITGIDSRTGKPREEFYTIRGSKTLTRREIEEEFAKAYGESQDADSVKYGLRDMRIQLESGAFNPDVPAIEAW